ncbi:hypothetical protein F4781DRAFT_382580 [Annulohypoxylon bovei var. microspora]|nr:hypothetical protein F4781DRAFT_382580 [Annulohypoxylon bovei var. microspora]
MPKAARDRINYPGGDGFPPGRNWSQPSSDDAITTQSIVEQILGHLGDLIDAIECTNWQDYSHIEWTQLAGPQSFKSKAPGPVAIADFVVDIANSISATYCRAVIRRRRQRPRARVDLPACKQDASPSTNVMLKITPSTARALLKFYGVIGDMFRRTSAQRVLENSLRTTESLQHLFNLLEQHSSKVISSYDELFPDKPPDLTNDGHLSPITIPAPQVSNPVPLAASTSRPNVVTPSSRRRSWWDRLRYRLSSS